MKRLTHLLLCLLLLSAQSRAQKIPLKPAMLSYYQGLGNRYIDLAPLVDEQAQITSSLEDKAAAPYPQSIWNPSWGTTPTILIDLGGTYQLSQVALFDGWNQAGLTVKYEKAGAWVTLFTWDMSYSEKWKVADVKVETGKLLLEFSDLTAQVGEIVLFGTAVTTDGETAGSGNDPVADTQSPTAPTQVSASAVTATTADLHWKASSDNSGVAGYEIYRNGSYFATVPGTSAALTDLSPATAYGFKVRAKDAANNLSGFSTEVRFTTAASSTEQSGTCTPSKLMLTPAMVVNEAGKGDATQLLDEQNLAGEPAQGKSGAPANTWFPGWNAADYPASAYMDFGETKTISAIFLRDTKDEGLFTVEAGSPGSWYPVLTDNLTGYNSWNQHDVALSTRYLRLTRHTTGANVSEVVVYGCTGSYEKDAVAPGRVTTLKAQPKSSNALQLTWTASGDDGDKGTAAGYIIRYSASPLTSEAAFKEATVLNSTPAPAAAGTAQSVAINGLAPATTYYVALKVRDEAGNVSALSNTVSATTADVVGPKVAQITIDQFIGINAFVDDPIDKMQVAGFVREYHDWNWDEGNIWSGGGNKSYPGYPNNQMKWAPSEPGWDFDDFYSKAYKAGLVISPDIQGAASWLQGGKDFPYHNKPVDEPGASTTNPNSYEKKAHHLFQFAARYGASHVADNKLTLAPGQPRRSGLGLIRYIEDWNEQDKNWEGPAAQFSPQEYAAMASADYDGHANTMKQGSGTFGVKNADPTMKFVMGGIYQLNLDYIRQMKSWFEKNRADKKFAADVINVHAYAWLTEDGPGGGGPAKSPEEYRFKEKLKAFVNYRDQNLPEVEVWISEFGWDTHPKSALRVPLIGPFDRQEVQGQWLVRAYLAFAAAGVDRAMIYMLRDVNPNDATHFSTSGLVGPNGSWAPKKSWFYVYTLKNTLQNMVFAGEQPSGNPNVLIYKFKSRNGGNGAYVLWAKTKENYTVSGYQLYMSGNPTAATQVEMVAGDTDGVSTPLPLNNGNVSVNVSEKPVFILVDKMK